VRWSIRTSSPRGSLPTDFAPEVGRDFVLETGQELGTIRGEVLEIDEPRLLRCRWSGVFGDTEVLFELFPESEGTRLARANTTVGRIRPRRARRVRRTAGKQKLTQDLPRLLDSANGKGIPS